MSLIFFAFHLDLTGVFSRYNVHSSSSNTAPSLPLLSSPMPNPLSISPPHQLKLKIDTPLSPSVHDSRLFIHTHPHTSATLPSSCPPVLFFINFTYYSIFFPF